MKKIFATLVLLLLAVIFIVGVYNICTGTYYILRYARDVLQEDIFPTLGEFLVWQLSAAITVTMGVIEIFVVTYIIDRLLDVTNSK